MCRADNGLAHEFVSKHRLPRSVMPFHYALTIRPDLKNLTFAGGEVIDVRVKRPVKQIVLNAIDLEITEAYLTDRNGSRLDASVVYDKEHELAMLELGGEVGRGNWQIHLTWRGEINKKLHGFYVSTYKDAQGKEHVIVSTQFEPGDARRAFPCFDEPSFKAKFTTRLVVDDGLFAIANGAPVARATVEEVYATNIGYGNGLVHEVPGVKKSVVDFSTTMKMSTYLVAWVVGEFEASETVNVNGKKLRILCPPGKKHMTGTALKSAQFAIDWFEKYFGIPYPGRKLDQIAIPDFAFGAMENTDCITYRETALLVNEKTATISELLRVVEVVAHEIAHQWFGNLVTMKWWNGLWLNEAFATFMAAKVVEAYRAEWDRWTSFGLERGAAMRVDGLVSSRAVEAVVQSVQQAQGSFDAITYRKGASALRMLEQYLGVEKFRKGVSAYLKEHAHGNTEGDDLWNALSKSSKQDVKAIMHSWVYQPGYPVVTVSESAITGSVTLSQRPFKYLAAQADNSLSWLVPVNLRFKNADGIQNQWVLVTEREQTIYVGEDVEWIVANAGGHGFYRTLYAPSLAAKLTVDVKNTLSAIERFNLVNDSWACTQAGLQTASEYVNIVKLFGDETDPNVWSVISGSLARLHGMLPAANQPAFEKLVRDLAAPTMGRLGWHAAETDSIQDRQLRGTIIALLGTTGGDTTVQAKADELFTAYKQQKSVVAADIVPAVVGLVAHTGDHADYEEFRKLHTSTNVPQEAVRYLGALASFRDQELLEKSLQALVDGTARTQDAPSLCMRLLANPAISARAWQFVKDNWDYIVKNYPENGLITMVSGVTALDTPELEEDVKAFFATHKVKGGDKAIAQSLEMLRVAVLFNQRESAALAAAFTA